MREHGNVGVNAAFPATMENVTAADPDPFPDQPDPHPAFARQRRQAAALHLKLPADGAEVWAVTRHAAALALFGETGVIKDQARARRHMMAAGRQTVDSTAIPTVRDVVSSDPPEHARLRRLVSDAFTVHRVRRLAPRIERIAHDILERLVPDGRAELIADFAFPLPITVICELLGVPRADSDAFRCLSVDLIDGDLDTAARANRRLTEYLDGVLARKRRCPEDDLLTRLVHRGERGEHRVPPDEIREMATTLLLTGFITTANLIGNGVLTLLDHPEQLAMLRRRPDVIPSAIEELLRYEPPAQLSTFRCATRPLSFGGDVVPRGAVVVANMASANRDPEVFADPETLDVTRSGNRHLSFGHGRHYCVGAPLARLEGAIALSAILSRLPDLRLAVPREEIRWRPGGFMRGLRALPVLFRPDSAAAAGGVA
jgi:cytochrome P450